MTSPRAVAATLALALAASCSAPDLPPPVAATTMPPRPVAAAPARVVPDVRATIVPGIVAAQPAPPAAIATQPRPGDVALNFPGVDVNAVAKAVLGDILGLQYSVQANLAVPVTLVTTRPVARADVLRLFEDALRASNLALVPQAGVFRIVSTDQARGSAPVVAGGGTLGFAQEVIPLQFVSAEELKKLLDPILPGVVVSADAARNIITVAGTTGQRSSVRDLVRQFDVNWLRGVSFALFVPQRTDARLIVPELDKLINAPGAPTSGLVRLIAMERLNGILAISGQAQYLADVRRWIDILDREGESAQAKLFVYRAQNSRSSDLARVIITALGGGGTVGGGQPGSADAIGSGRQFGGGSGSFGGSGQSGGSGFGSPPGGVNASGAGDTALARGGRGFGANGAVTPAQTGANALTAANRLATPAAGQAAPDARGALSATITSDEANNAILVYGTPREYAVIEDALRQLDIPPSQVMIEAAISEVTLTDELRYGVQTLFDVGNANVTLTETGPNIGTSVLPSLVRALPGFSFLYADRDITAILNALEGLTKINVLSAPKLLVINNQTASLQVGNQVPVVSAQNNSGLTGTTNEIEYRDTGVILKITPRVNAGGLVLLDVAQEVSDVTQSVSTTAGETSPTFSTRRIATSIAVQDGQTIALGGLISDSRQRTKTGIPFLSRIPIIGGLLFGRTNNNDKRTELLILLRPRVIRGVDDGRAITDELRAKIRQVRPIRPGDSLP